MAWPSARGTNPYCRYFSGALADQGFDLEEFSISSWRLGFARCDMLLVHWPEAAARSANPVVRFVSFVAFLTTVILFRVRGGRVAWVFHNARPHVINSRIFGWLFRWWASNVDCLLSPSFHGLEVARAMYPSLQTVPSAVSRIGSYDFDPQSDPVMRPSGRTRLMSFGILSPYKGIEQAIDATGELGPEVELVVAGRAHHADYATELLSLAKHHDNVEIDEGFKTDDELNALLRSADGVILPFQKTLHSSTVVAARSTGVRVFAPAIGAIPEYAELDPGIVLFTPPLTANKLREFVESDLSRLPIVSPDFDWLVIGSETAAAILEALDAPDSERAAEVAQ